MAKVALIAGIIAGRDFRRQGEPRSNLATSVPAAAGIGGFFAALLSSLWAYDGWNNVNMIAGEVRRRKATCRWP